MMNAQALRHLTGQGSLTAACDTLESLNNLRSDLLVKDAILNEQRSSSSMHRGDNNTLQRQLDESIAREKSLQVRLDESVAREQTAGGSARLETDALKAQLQIMTQALSEMTSERDSLLCKLKPESELVGPEVAAECGETQQEAETEVEADATAALKADAPAALKAASSTEIGGVANKFCTECGTSLATGERFCTECGTEQAGASGTIAQLSPSAKAGVLIRLSAACASTLSQFEAENSCAVVYPPPGEVGWPDKGIQAPAATADRRATTSSNHSATTTPRDSSTQAPAAAAAVADEAGIAEASEIEPLSPEMAQFDSQLLELGRVVKASETMSASTSDITSQVSKCEAAEMKGAAASSSGAAGTGSGAQRSATGTSSGSQQVDSEKADGETPYKQDIEKQSCKKGQAGERTVTSDTSRQLAERTEKKIQQNTARADQTVEEAQKQAAKSEQTGVNAAKREGAPADQSSLLDETKQVSSQLTDLTSSGKTQEVDLEQQQCEWQEYQEQERKWHEYQEQERKWQEYQQQLEEHLPTKSSISKQDLELTQQIQQQSANAVIAFDAQRAASGDDSLQQIEAQLEKLSADFPRDLAHHNNCVYESVNVHNANVNESPVKLSRFQAYYAARGRGGKGRRATRSS